MKLPIVTLSFSFCSLNFVLHAQTADSASSDLVVAAERGDVSAQFRLGKRFQVGTPEAKDLTEAANWFRKAADGGNTDAQAELGMMLVQGEGISANPTEAEQWLLKAAQGRSALAKFGLGILYWKGAKGVKKDVNKAVVLLDEAVKLGHAGAGRLLGTMYIGGVSVKKDESKGVTYFRNAAELGDFIAQRELGRMYLVGSHGCKNDLKEARRWLEPAAAKMDPESMGLYGGALMDGAGPTEAVEALAWMALAANGGEKTARTNYAKVVKTFGKDVEQKTIDRGNEILEAARAKWGTAGKNAEANTSFP